MSHRLQVVLPDPVIVQIRELAAVQGEPPSTLAGRMVREAVAAAARDGRVRPLRVAQPIVAPRVDGRARWLEPYGGDGSWSQQMWGAIVALHGRYPRYLEALKDGWWADDAHLEMLCALAVWRADIDEGGEDPREEFAFQAQLSAYAEDLRRQGGGVAKAWLPGVAPEDWCRA